MTLMPVSRTSCTGRCCVNAGGFLCVSHCSPCTSPRPSMGFPSTLKRRPSVAVPTGVLMPILFVSTRISRRRPSPAEIMMQRTLPSPMCCAASMTYGSSESGMVSSVQSMERMGGRVLSSKKTSATGPITCMIVPVFNSVSILSPFGRLLPSRRQPLP